MAARFPTHVVRQVTDLSGVWDFTFVDDRDIDSLDRSSLAFDELLPVPGCFDATPRYAGRRGIGAYRRSIRLQSAGHHRISIDGAHHVCRVYVDRVAVCDHFGGFTRFGCDFDVEPTDVVTGGTHELVIVVDNRLDYDRCPLHLDYFDWYHYGGVTRGVELQRLGELWIERARFETLDLGQRRVRLTVEYASSTPAPAVEVLIEIDGEAVARRKEEGVGGGAERFVARSVVCELELPSVEPWTPENPRLVEVSIRLQSGDCADDFRFRTGLRTVEAADGQIRLNGVPIRLFGFNRHEAHPAFGHAVPVSVKIGDLQVLRQMGCNFIRGSHYPPDHELLDLCDEMGFLYWCESIGWQHTVEHLSDERFLSLQERHIEEMVREHINHPSVVIWGLLNESESHVAAARPGYERLIRTIRELDAGRPVTYASNHIFDDLCLDLVDIVSVNCYPGWYIGEIDGVAEYIDSFIDHIDQAGCRDKPIILSEIGAGAVPGFRDWNAARWSEEYQARLVSTVMDVFAGGNGQTARRRLSGLALWQFCDIRASNTTARTMGRPRGFNNKGVVDEWRRPKQAYYTIRDREWE